MRCEYNELGNSQQTEKYIEYAKEKISRALRERKAEEVVMICPATVVSRNGLGKLLDVFFGKKVLLESLPPYEKAIKKLQREGYRLTRVRSKGYSAFRVIVTLQ